MHRWSFPFIATLMLLSGQTALAAQPAQGVVRDLADANNARCHNPEGITASPNGLLFAAGPREHLHIRPERERARPSHRRTESRAPR